MGILDNFSLHVLLNTESSSLSLAHKILLYSLKFVFPDEDIG